MIKLHSAYFISRDRSLNLNFPHLLHMSALMDDRSAADEPQMTEEDPFKSMGSLVFRIDNFSELPPGKISMRHCDARVSVRGLSFGLAVCPARSNNAAQQNIIRMGVIVKCENVSGCNMEGDGSWSCLASVAIRIKSMLGDDENIYKFTHLFFSGKQESSLEWTGDRPLDFDKLVDPKNGFYNEKENTLELIVQISVDPPAGVMELPKKDTIRVNGETVHINKNQLAMHSDFFNEMFYNRKYREGQSGEYKVEIGAPATVEHFKRMLATMCPMNQPLDDECIEGVLHLANQFLVTSVEGKCLEFLMKKSKKPALFKFRMAVDCGFAVLKKYVLLNLEVADFKDKMTMVNAAEIAQLGPDAVEELKARFDKLFP